MNRQNKNHSEPKQNMFTRRGFCKRILAASAFTSLGAIPACTAKSEMRKIKLGVVGCGGRGTWITGLFTEHGGYEIHSVADYFQEATDKCG